MAKKYYINHQLDKDIALNAFGKNHRVKAGTNIKILGWYVRVPELEGNTEAWLVETENGIRGLCEPDQLEDVLTRHSLAIYDHARQDDDWIYFHRVVYDEDLEKQRNAHISFEQFDSIYGPAINAGLVPETGKFYAAYRGWDILHGDYLKEGMIATFVDNHLESVKEATQKDAKCYKWLAPYANNWMTHSVAYTSPGFYMPMKGYGPFQGRFYPYKWIARGMQGVYDVLFVFLVAVLFSSLFIFLFAENKSVSNTFIGTSIFLCCGTAYTLYCYYTMELSANLFCFGFTSLFMIVIASTSENRCPKCHSLVDMQVVDTTYGEVKTKVYDTYHSKDRKVDEWKGINQDGKVYDREYSTVRLTEHERAVTNVYRCPHCGYTYEVNSTQKLGSNWQRLHTGTDRVTVTRTWKS